MTGITVTRRDDRLLATKVTDSRDAARTLREADLLRRLRHPGVVEYVALDEGPPLALHTGFVGPDTWLQRPPNGDHAIVDGLTAVASIVADLHDSGIAHRALAPDHVLVAADRRPVLCGFADSTDADDPAVFEDLQGLAALIDRVRTGAGPELAECLSTIARRAEQGGLTARALAAELATTHPSAGSRRSRRRVIRTRPASITTMVGVVVIALAAWLVSTSSSGATGDADARGPADLPESPGPPEPLRAALPSRATDGTTAPHDDIDRPVTSDPLVIEHGGRRYGVGQADHIAVIGDWRCRGSSTPAVLDPSTGLVAFFDAWPAEGAHTTAVLTVGVPDAVDLRVDPDSCGVVRVVQPAGSTLLRPELP